MSHPVRHTLLSRVKPEWKESTRIKPLLKAMDAVFDANDALREKHSTLAKDAKLSPIGRVDEVRAATPKLVGSAVQRARATLKSTTADIEAWQTRLLPKAADKSDLTSAIVREGIRTRLVAMPAAKRMAVLVDPKIESAVVQAILEAPEFSTGVSHEDRRRMIDSVVQRTHPDDLTAIAELEEAAGLLAAAVGVTVNTAKSITEFSDDRLFEPLLGPPVSVSAIEMDPDDPMHDILVDLGKYAKDNGIKSMSSAGTEYHDGRFVPAPSKGL